MVSRDLQDGYNVHPQSHIDYLKGVVTIQLQVNKQETSCEYKMKNPASEAVIQKARSIFQSTPVSVSDLVLTVQHSQVLRQNYIGL